MTLMSIFNTKRNINTIHVLSIEPIYSPLTLKGQYPSTWNSTLSFYNVVIVFEVRTTI